MNLKKESSSPDQASGSSRPVRRSTEIGLLTAVFIVSAFAAFLFVRAELRSAEMNQDPNVIFFEPTPEPTRTGTI